MQLLLKSVWWVTIAVGVVSIVLFIVGITALFQRTPDIIGTVMVFYLWIPNVILITVLTVLMIKKMYPTNVFAYFGIVIAIVLSFFFSSQLFQNINTNGWITETDTHDSTKITVDGKYEYYLEIVNLYHRNSYARLYVRDISSGDEKWIKTKIKTNEIGLLIISKEMVWATLDSTDVRGKYYLTTTKELKIPQQRYEIDLNQDAAYK